MHAYSGEIGRGLDAVELGVLTTLCNECVVRTHFRHFRAIQHDDEIGHAHGAEAVGHENRDTPVGCAACISRAACRHRIPFEQCVFCFRSQCSRLLVEEQRQFALADEAALVEREACPRCGWA